MLAWHATSVFYDPARWPYKLEKCVPRKLSRRLNREFRRRHNPSLDPAKVRQFGFWEWSETLMRRLGHERLSRYCNRNGNRAFCQQTIRLIEREPVDLLWGYDTSALEVFQWAAKRGIRCVLDQTTPHPAMQNQVMLAEYERHPEFFVSSFRPHDQVSIERQDAEMAEADQIVVGSDFCRRTLIEQGCPGQKAKVIHYGYDDSLFPGQALPRPAKASPGVDFLFAGMVGPGKGIAYLLQAFANIPANRARLTLVGRLAIPAATFQKYAARVHHVPQVPRREVVSFFTSADCFVLPSLFEGGAVVLNEACGAGLCIVQSDRSGDVVPLNQNGIVLKEISVAALTEAIERVAGDAELRQRCQAASWACRGQRTWGEYRLKVVKLASGL